MAKNPDVKNIDGLTNLTGITKTSDCMTNVNDISYRNNLKSMKEAFFFTVVDFVDNQLSHISDRLGLIHKK